MTISFDFLYGMALGILFADAESCAEEGISWGVVLMLGPIVLMFERDL